MRGDCFGWNAPHSVLAMTLIFPLHMPQRSAVELVTEMTPLRHEFIHQAYEICVVRRFQQVDQLMHENIFEALRRLLGKLCVQADGALLWSTASPACLHPADNDIPGLDT